MNATRNRLVDGSLRRLDRALRDLPGDRRREIVEETGPERWRSRRSSSWRWAG